MDETVTVDVEKGDAVRAPMTAADKKNKQRVVEGGERAEREQVAEEASRDGKHSRPGCGHAGAPPCSGWSAG